MTENIISAIISASMASGALLLLLLHRQNNIEQRFRNELNEVRAELFGLRREAAIDHAMLHMTQESLDDLFDKEVVNEIRNARFERAEQLKLEAESELIVVQRIPKKIVVQPKKASK